ncbi:MAG: hypothetical protein ABSB49_20060 [Polyangia bacterium]|jgi:hypothetical protein
MDLSRAGRPREDGVLHWLGVVAFTAFLLAFVILFHWNYPDTGHDFGGVFVKLMEGRWHYYHRGLAVPRYSVHVCGGSVQYGNPEDLFYSPAQMLCLVLDPWIVIQLTVGAALVAGYVGWYRVGRDILRLAPGWAHLMALVVQANGFYLLQMLAGHFMFHALPLLGWFTLLLFEREHHAGRSLVKRAVAFAMLCAYALYSANWLVLYFLALSLMLVLPLDLFLAESPGRRARELLVRWLLYGAATLALTASKLVAIYSFMRFFPRQSQMATIDGFQSALGYIVRALWAIPQSEAVLASAPNYVHEKSMLMPPVTLLGLAVGVVLLWLRLSFGTTARGLDRWFVALFGSLSFTAMVQLVSGRGWLAENLHSLPVGASQRISTRYLYLFALLLSVAAVWSLARVMRQAGRGWNLAVIVLAAVTTVAAFAVAHVRMLTEVGLASNMRDHRATWRRTMRDDVVQRVSSFTEFDGATGRTCYEPILNAAGTPSQILHEGSVSDKESGYFNLMNPACYQYPVENHCRPGDRISAADGDNLARFTRGRPVTWKISVAQQVADWLTLLSLVALVAVLCGPRIVWILRRAR